MRKTLFASLLGAALAVPGFAQDRGETVASVRTDLSALAATINGLRAELDAGGTQAIQAAGGASALDRLAAMEAELARLTKAAEAAQNRIDKVVADGTNRIGDLEFRVCEIEEGCDTSNLPITASLGGEAPKAAGGGTEGGTAAGGASGGTAAPELAVNEQADFDRAKAALDAGDWQGAADQFARFAQTYTGGPLAGDAAFYRGEALSNLGQTAEAARAYLDAFSGRPDGPRAAVSLLRLGTSLGQLGQAQEACVTLAEVGRRFPSAPEVAEAGAAMQGLGCS
ncbi:MAG: tol-pal system protein YbgF [Paracoccaceae bacterium]